MLVFPRLVLPGDVPNVDFLHLYGPASLDVLVVWYRIFGYSLESQRTFGLLQHLGIIFAVYALARAWPATLPPPGRPRRHRADRHADRAVGAGLARRASRSACGRSCSPSARRQRQA